MKYEWRACCVRIGSSIRDAANAIGAGRVGIALLVDSNKRLVGTITDGDIRRAVLAGALLTDPVEHWMMREFCHVPPGIGRAEVLDLMHARGIAQIPVLDESGRVLGLHTMREIAGIADKPNIAVVMAGGRGSRLGDLTSRTPKPMLRVAGRPILERLVLHLVGHGIRRIFISVHYLAGVIEDHFGDGKSLGCQIEYLREKEPLGTCGCLSLLPEKPEDDVLVCNGDLVTQVDFDAMLRFHHEGSYAATVGASSYTHTVPFGVLRRRKGSLEAIEEKPGFAYEVNAGVYILGADVVADIPEKFLPITELISTLLGNNKTVGVYPIENDWLDVGERQHLNRARGESHS